MAKLAGEEKSAHSHPTLLPNAVALQPTPGDDLRGLGKYSFDYIEGFYNRVRRHKHLDQLSPHEFERQRQTAL